MKKIILIIAAFVATDFIIGQVVQSQDKFSCGNATVTVVSGDTMWKIIEDNCTGNWESARAFLVNKYGVNINPGQIIQLP